MTTDELRALPPTVSLMTAARALGCGRSLAYDLARRNQFPCRIIRLGSRYLVPTADLLHTLGVKVDSSTSPSDQQPSTPATASRQRRQPHGDEIPARPRVMTPAEHDSE